MQEFERGPLREYTPCRIAMADAQANALAVVHAELILIHPLEVGGYFFRLTRGLRTAPEVLVCPSTA